MMPELFFFIIFGLCCLTMAPLFLFQNDGDPVSFTAPGLMLVGIMFVLIGCCGFVGLESYGG